MLAGGGSLPRPRRPRAGRAPAPRSPVDRAAPAPAAHVIAHIDSIGGSPPRMSRVGTSLGSELTGPSGVRTVCSSRIYHDSALAASPSELTDTIKLYIKLCVLLL